MLFREKTAVINKIRAEQTAKRAFLQGFRLSGEAQKLDRIMQKFPVRYCTFNPKGFIIISLVLSFIGIDNMFVMCLK